VAVEIVAQDIRILALHPRWHRLSDKRKGLVTIEPTQLHDLAIQREAVIREGGLAESDAPRILIDRAARFQQPHVNRIELGITQIPQLYIGQASQRDDIAR